MIKNNSQLDRVFRVMRDGKKRSLEKIAQMASHRRNKEGKDSEAAVSARIRDLRKEEFGNHDVHSERDGNGHWKYWMREKV